MGLFSWKKKKVNEGGVALVRRSSAVFSTVLDSMKEETRQKYLKIYKNAYEKVPLCTAIVDRTVEQTVQEFFWEGNNVDNLKKETKRLRLKLWMHKIETSCLAYGDAFSEAVKPTPRSQIKQLKVISPLHMRVYRDKTGDTIGYGQIIENKYEVLWGKSGKGPAYDRKFKKHVKDISSIMHFKHKALDSEKYGRSVIHPLIRPLEIKLDMEENLKKIVWKYGSPLIWAKVGNDNMPASEDAVGDISETLRDLSAESEITTTHLVELDVLDFNAKGMDIKTPLLHTEQQIVTGGGVPPVQLGRASENEQAAERQDRNFGRRIKFIQAELAAQVEDLLVVGQGLGGAEDRLIWVQSQEQEFEIITDIIRGLVTDRCITPQKGNDLLPERYREDLPEEYELMGAERGSQFSNDKETDNPNDPTQTKKNPKTKGKRVTKRTREEKEAKKK